MMIREKERSAQASRDTVMKKIKLLEASMTYSDVGVSATTTEEVIGEERPIDHTRLHSLMHEGGANNGQDCMIFHEPKASALSTIETIIGLA